MNQKDYTLTARGESALMWAQVILFIAGAWIGLRLFAHGIVWLGKVLGIA